MSASSPSNGQNLRLFAIATLAAIALGTVMTSSSTSADDRASADSSGINVTSQEAEDLTPETVSATSLLGSSTAPTTIPPAPSTTALSGTDEMAEVVVIAPRDQVDGPAAVSQESVVEATVFEACAVTAEANEPAAPSDPDVFYADGFTSADAWDALSGQWSVVDGEYRQTEASGYDLIAQLRVDPPERFRVAVTLRPIDGPLGGGLIVGQPIPADRSGATVVDFTDGGSFLRWGSYDSETAQYNYLGGVAMGDGFDGSAAHTLTVEVRDERTLVLVDGVEVGTFGPVSFGRVGLVTSKSQVAFDDLSIVEVGS